MTCPFCGHRIATLLEAAAVQIAPHIAFIAHASCALMAELFSLFGEDHADWPEPTPDLLHRVLAGLGVHNN